MLCSLLEIVTTATKSQFASGVAVRTMKFTCLPHLLFDPSREATDPRFEFHVLVVSNKVQRNGRDEVMFVLVSIMFVTLLSEPTTNLAINLSELVTDDATTPEPPEGLLQLPVSANFLFVKP